MHICGYDILKCSIEGCNWVGERRVQNEHENGCSYRVANCPNEGCNKQLRQKEINAHLQFCNYESISCPNNCGYSNIRLELDSHLLTDCTLVMLECRYKERGCEERIVRSNFHFHLSTCRLKPVILSCLHELNKMDVEEHKQTCPNYPLKCSGCGYIQQRTILANHECLPFLLLKIQKLEEKTEELQSNLNKIKLLGKIPPLKCPKCKILKMGKWFKECWKCQKLICETCSVCDQILCGCNYSLHNNCVHCKQFVCCGLSKCLYCKRPSCPCSQCPKCKQLYCKMITCEICEIKYCGCTEIVCKDCENESCNCNMSKCIICMGIVCKSCGGTARVCHGCSNNRLTLSPISVTSTMHDGYQLSNVLTSNITTSWCSQKYSSHIAHDQLIFQIANNPVVTNIRVFRCYYNSIKVSLGDTLENMIQAKEIEAWKPKAFQISPRKAKWLKINVDNCKMEEKPGTLSGHFQIFEVEAIGVEI